MPRPRPPVAEDVVASGHDSQLKADCATLREVFDGFERLEAMYEHASRLMQAGSRGYFTPDEDNEVRRLLLAYRNYRLACWDVIWRHYLAYRAGGDASEILRGFIVGYAAALRLYQKSLRLIEIVEFDPMLRAKLNEPDRKFDLEAGFFEDVLASYSSLSQYFRATAAGTYWRANLRRVRKLGLEDDPVIGWLIPVIVRERRALRGRFWFILGKRLRRDWRAACRMLVTPFSLMSYGALGGLARILYKVNLGGAVHGITERSLDHLGTVLRPGDVLLMRADDKITTALLPGFWAHAAVYIGTQDELRAMGLAEEPKVSRLKRFFDRMPTRYGYVIEALTPGCHVHTLEACLDVDHVAVLRPNVSADELRASLVEAFSHVGKRYDFEFDFNVSSRVVCTEVVYRSLHGRGPIRFELVKRLGRYTLSADDLVEQQLVAHEKSADAAPFTVVDVLIREGRGEAVPLREGERVARLRALLRSGSEAQV